MRTHPLLFALALSSCSVQEDTAPAPPANNLFLSVSGDGLGHEPPEGFTGTWIDVVPGVEFQKRIVTGDGAQPRDDTRLNGHPLTVEGAYLVIGPSRYGPLPSGTRVQVRPDGVFVDGKSLGPLPERAPAPADGK